MTIHQPTLNAIVERIVTRHAPERIVLFGSHARGDAVRGSDVDLLIVMDSALRPLDRRVTVRRSISDVRRTFGLDLMVLTPRELEQRNAKQDPFIKTIQKEGKVLYERRPDADLR